MASNEPGVSTRGVFTRWSAVAPIALLLVTTFSGVPLGCSEDVAADCNVGSEGCACYDNGTCDGDGEGGGLVCSAGVCQKALCTVGSEHCACFKNFTCDKGLQCVPDPSGPHCESACPEGQIGCACLPNDDCVGDDLFCSEGVCDSHSCPIGTRGCHCDGDNGCGDGLECIGHVCHESGVPLSPPANPKCYTPCRSDLELGGGKVRPCSEEGLMEGCVGDKVCVNGSCV